MLGLLGISTVYEAAAQSDKQEGSPKSEKELVEQLGGTKPLLSPSTTAPVNSINQSVLEQQGRNNVGQIVQIGQSLRTSIVQVGQGNVAYSTLDGQGTTSEIVQQGNENRLEQQLTDAGRRYFSVEQLGNRNELRQSESGSSLTYPTGYEVKMQGNGIKMEIKQGVAGTLP